MKHKVEVTQEWIRKQSQATPVLYLDLDGTVRHGKDELGHFANSAAEVKVFPEVPTLLAGYRQKGWRIVAISNQGGVALGYLSDTDCAEMMMETQRQCRGLFDQICYCTHHPDAPDPEYAVCWCRKPRDRPHSDRRKCACRKAQRILSAAPRAVCWRPSRG